MEDLLNQFFMEHLAASVIVTIIAVALLIFFVWKTSQIWYRIKHLPCDNNAEMLKTLTEKSFDKSELPCKESQEILRKLTEKSFDKSELPCKESQEILRKLTEKSFDKSELPCKENTEILKKLTEKSFDKSELPCKENTEILKKLTEKSFDKSELPCKEHADKVIQHDKDVFELKTTLSYMNKTMENMNTTLKSLIKPMGIPMTQQNSPLKITEEGWRVAEELGMKEMFEKKWNDIEKLISEHAKSKNPYDVNDFCIQWAVVYPEQFLEEKDLDKVKLYAYKKGIDLSEYMKIIAVMSRDKYFDANHIVVE